MVSLSIVVPAYEEQESLPVLCRKINEILDPIYDDYEILIVDDGSRDETWNVVDRLHASDPRILGIKLTRNFGHQNAIMAGFREAHGRAVITMDADLQHPPELIPELINRWQDGFMVVNTMRQSTEKEPFLKRLTSSFFYKLFSFLTGTKMKSGMADFRLLDRAVIRELNRYNEPFIFLRGLVQWMGFPTTEVVFAAPERQLGFSKYSWHRMLRLALSGITSFSILPLRMSILIGIVTAGLAFCELLYVFYIALVKQASIPGWASTMGALSFLLGILFIMLGIIGEYIGRIFETVKGRPLYVVETRIETSKETKSNPPPPLDSI